MFPAVKFENESEWRAGKKVANRSGRGQAADAKRKDSETERLRAVGREKREKRKGGERERERVRA